MMLEEVHVKLCRITKLDLGPEIDVAELRCDVKTKGILSSVNLSVTTGIIESFLNRGI